MEDVGTFGTFYGKMVYVFFPVLVCCTEKNLATLQERQNVDCATVTCLTSGRLRLVL
jgi:hypothetical protein